MLRVRVRVRVRVEGFSANEERPGLLLAACTSSAPALRP